MNKQPLISIIVPSYTITRLKDLLALLISIKAQTYPHIETIIVIEHSVMLTDRIKAFARSNPEMKIKIVFIDTTGATSARNLGISYAEGEYLAFIDDDAKLSPEWAEVLVETYRDRNIVGATGPILPAWNKGENNWFPPEFDWVIGCSRWVQEAGPQETRSVMGANASFRKEAMKMAGHYSSTLGARKSQQNEWGVVAEEAELSLRVKQKTGGIIVYNPKLVVYHKVADYKLSIGFLTERAYQVGRTRRMIKSLAVDNGQQNDILSTEKQLLGRIFTYRVPLIFLNLFRHPYDAIRQVYVTSLVLFFVGAGYFSYSLTLKSEPDAILLEQKGS
jgi:glycosyltransferase involved in cell wall biosynthesis